MKVLVATNITQGQRSDDFSWTTEGELVMFPFECDGEEIEGKCGCRRSMSGFVSHRATTTFMIAEVPYSRFDYKAQYVASMRAAGWFRSVHTLTPGEEAIANQDINELMRIAGLWPVGAVLEKRGGQIHTRNRTKAVLS